MRAEAALDPRSAQELKADEDSDRLLGMENAAVYLAGMFPDEAREALALGLEPEHFFFATPRRAWELIAASVQAGEPLHLFAIMSHLKSEERDPETVYALNADDAIYTAHMPTAVREVKAAAAKRARAKLSDRVRSNGASDIDLGDELRRIEDLEHGKTRSRFSKSDVTAVEFLRKELVRPIPLMGDNVLTAGGLCVLYSKPGLGKTWIALMLLRSLARGEDWFDLPCVPGGIPVGFMELEISESTTQDRIRSLGIGLHPNDVNLRIVVRPNLKGVVDLSKASEIRELRSWIIERELKCVVIDALSRSHTVDENQASDMGPMLAALDALRHETGCAIILIHHERKTGPDYDPENHLDALRGSSKLQSDPTLLIRIVEMKGIRSIVFAKVSEGPEPDPIFYKVTKQEGGGIETVQSPKDRAQANLDAILTAIEDAGAGATWKDIVASTGLSRTTVYAHLKELSDEGRIDEFRSGKFTLYTTISPNRPISPSGHFESEPSGPSEMPGRTDNSFREQGF